MIPELRPPTDLFGVPLAIRRQDARQLVDVLGELWLAQAGAPAGAVKEDLGTLFAGLFNPKTSGARLREMLTALPEAPPFRARFLGPPLIIQSGTSVIITPEGRAVYGLLRQLLEDSLEDPLGIDLSDTLSVVSAVYGGYREGGVRRLQDAVNLLSGTAEGLRLPSLALVLFVLVNGSVSPETAIRRPANSEELSRLDRSVGRAISAFSDILSSRHRDPSHFSLYSGYAATEARRRLGSALGPSPGEIYIRPEHREAVIQRVAQELRRRKRSPEAERVLTAFDNLVSAYRAERPTLASMGVTNESQIETTRLRGQLERALGDP